MSEKVLCDQRHWDEVEGGAMGVSRIVALTVLPWC